MLAIKYFDELEFEIQLDVQNAFQVLEHRQTNVSDELYLDVFDVVVDDVDRN